MHDLLMYQLVLEKKKKLTKKIEPGEENEKKKTYKKNHLKTFRGKKEKFVSERTSKLVFEHSQVRTFTNT